MRRGHADPGRGRRVARSYDDRTGCGACYGAKWWKPAPERTCSGGDARACPVVADVVVTDLCMSAGGGLDLIRFFRGHRATRAVPIIAMSAAADPRTVQTVLEAGASAFLEKPFDVPVLAGKIRELAGGETGAPEDAS